MDRLEKVVDLMTHWPSKKPHAGQVFVSGQEEKAGQIILRRSWVDRKATASLFKMATEVSGALEIELTWEERFDLGRFLLSCLTRTGIYYLERKKKGKTSMIGTTVITTVAALIDSGAKPIKLSRNIAHSCSITILCKKACKTTLLSVFI